MSLSQSLTKSILSVHKALMAYTEIDFAGQELCVAVRLGICQSHDGGFISFRICEFSASRKLEKLLPT